MSSDEKITTTEQLVACLTVDDALATAENYDESHLNCCKEYFGTLDGAQPDMTNKGVAGCMALLAADEQKKKGSR